MPSGRSLALAKGPSRPMSGQIEKPPIPDVPETHFFISGPRARPKARLSIPSDHCVQRTSSVPGRLRKRSVTHAAMFPGMRKCGRPTLDSGARLKKPTIGDRVRAHIRSAKLACIGNPRPYNFASMTQNPVPRAHNAGRWLLGRQ